MYGSFRGTSEYAKQEMGLLSALWSCSDLAASPDRISPSVKPLSSLSAPKLAPSNSPLFLSRCERTVESLRGRTHVEKATRKQISLSLSVCLSLSLALFLPSFRRGRAPREPAPRRPLPPSSVEEAPGPEELGCFTRSVWPAEAVWQGTSPPFH